MENLIIDKTNQTPGIIFKTNGDLLINGISTPDNVQKLFQPVFIWLNEFQSTKPLVVNLTLEIDYLNTSSTRILVELLVLINSFKQHDAKINIVWCYEEGDDDMLELGEDLQLSSKSTFAFKAI